MAQLGEEAMFPGYVFARINLATEFRKVIHARGIRGFVRMGERYPTIDDADMSALEHYCSIMSEGVHRPMAGLAPGDSVELLGALHGNVQGEVAELLPARNRVRVLFEFLGRRLEMEVASEHVLRMTH